MANRTGMAALPLAGLPLAGLLLLAGLISGALLYAQEGMGAAGDYGIEQRFVQRLSWDHDPLVFRYEVILEEERDTGYEELLRESTTVNSLSLSLRPGAYRYAVQVYNLYRKLEYTMDWVYFTVLNALTPEVLTFSPEAFFLDGGPPWQLTLTGRNIDPQALIVLRPRGIPAEDAEDIRPLSIVAEDAGGSLLLTFNREQLVPGNYNVYIRNPGGLEDSLGIFRVLLHEEGGAIAPDRSRWPDFMVSAGYAPAIPLYGRLFSGDAFTNPVFPLGLSFRFGLLPLKRNWGYLGTELNVSWFSMKDQSDHGSADPESADTYTVAAHDIGVHLNLLYQLWLRKRTIALTIRLGAGINLLRDFYFDYGGGREDPMSSAYIALDAGVSFQWRIRGPFCIEAGLDLIHVLSTHDPSPLGYLRPVLSLSWQF